MPGPVAILSAMQEELSAVLAAMPDARRVELAGRSFWLADWQGQSVVAVQSRIGKVAAATTATLLATHFGARAMLFTGVAGGLAPAVRVGDIVVGSGFLQHDMDASPIFPRHEVPLYGRSVFAADARLHGCLLQAAQATLLDLALCVGPAAVAEFSLGQVRAHGGLIVSGDRL